MRFDKGNEENYCFRQSKHWWSYSRACSFFHLIPNCIRHFSIANNTQTQSKFITLQTPIRYKKIAFRSLFLIIVCIIISLTKSSFQRAVIKSADDLFLSIPRLVRTFFDLITPSPNCRKPSIQPFNEVLTWFKSGIVCFIYQINVKSVILKSFNFEVTTLSPNRLLDSLICFNSLLELFQILF